MKAVYLLCALLIAVSSQGTWAAEIAKDCVELAATKVKAVSSDGWVLNGIDVDFGIYGVPADPAKREWGSFLVGAYYQAAGTDESSLSIPRSGYCDRTSGRGFYTLHFNYNGVAAAFSDVDGKQRVCQTLFDAYLGNSCKYLTVYSVSGNGDDSWDHINLGSDLNCKYAATYDELMKKQQDQIAICKRIAAERPESIGTDGRVWPFL